MIRNYIIIAWRNLRNQPFFTLLNTFGLAIGMAGALLIALFIYDELSFDKMWADSERIYRINADIKFGGTETTSAEVSAPMAGAMKKDFPQIETATRFRNNGSMLIRKLGTTANVKEEHVTFVDSTFFEMFGVELLIGDESTALNHPNTLIITRSAAEKHFGVQEAIGQSLILNNTDTYTVTGVMEDMPKNSMLREHTVFMSMQSYPDAQDNEWGSHNYFTFIKLIPSAKIEDLSAPLQSMLGNYLIPWIQRVFPGMTEQQFFDSGNYLYYKAFPLTDIHLHSNRKPELSPNNDIQSVYILGFIGLFLIILASVNFMNLSTAQSLKRAKEVGIRKTLGSTKRNLLSQFLTESGLISFISLILALIIAAFAMNSFNNLAGKEISMPFFNPFFILVIVISTIVLGLFSGIYPAFFLARFNPVKVLKGGASHQINKGNIRNGLVIFQFCISVFLIVSTLVVLQQLKFIQNKDLGYSKSQVLIVEDVFAVGDNTQFFKEEVKSLTDVESVSLSSYLPTPSNRSNSSFFKEGEKEQEKAINMQEWRVDFDYLSTLDIEIIAGRDFDPKFGADSSSIILNEAAVAILGITPEEALGLRISSDLEDESSSFRSIIGVVKNFHFESLRDEIGALSMHLGRYSNAMAVKIKPGNVSNTIADIEKKWNSVALGQPFNYYFMEDEFNETYKSEKRLSKIFLIFTFLSIFIACLGLFGLAAFNAEKRTKEIGVRKVLGATVSQITYKLSIDFIKLVALSIIIASPLAWYAMNKWLQDFSFRIEIGWGIFILAALLAVLISLFTVGSLSMKAAMANPLKNLRTE